MTHPVSSFHDQGQPFLQIQADKEDSLLLHGRSKNRLDFDAVDHGRDDGINSYPLFNYLSVHLPSLPLRVLIGRSLSALVFYRYPFHNAY